jgi:hypothetical protein
VALSEPPHGSRKVEDTKYSRQLPFWSRYALSEFPVRSDIQHFVQQSGGSCLTFSPQGTALGILFEGFQPNSSPSTDRTGRRAIRVAEQLQCRARSALADARKLQGGRGGAGYDEARSRARSLGFEYIESGQLLQLPAERRLGRLKALIAGRLENDATARSPSLLGTRARPSFLLSKRLRQLLRLK